LSRNFGHQIAITAGLDVCDSQATIILDGDLQHPPELIIDLYSKYKEGYEVVYAKRKNSQNERFFKKKSAKIFYLLLRKITNIEIPLNTGDFRIIDQKVVNLLREMPEQNKFLRGQIAWLGFKQTEILFSIDKRKHGKSSYSFAKMFRFAIDGITSFSDVPLQVVTKAGIIISFVSLFIILYAIYAHFIIKQTITGWTSLIISSMFIGGVQLISIGIIGEYISRINKNILKRPLYIIEKSNIKKNRFQKKDIKIY
jgi:dolichol-phosphate mannosyltransferase